MRFCRCTPLHRAISDAASPLAQCSQHCLNGQTGLDLLCVVFSPHYVVSNSTPPPQILKNRMWACTWVRAGQSCSGCKVNMTPWGDFLIMNTKRMSALIRLRQYAELLTVHFPFFSSLLFHGFNLIQLCVDSLLLLFILGFDMWTISYWHMVGLIFSIQTWQDFIFIFIPILDLQCEKVINDQPSNMDGHF